MPAEDPNEMQRGSTPAKKQPDEDLMAAEQAIEDDFGGSGEPTDKMKENLERKVEEVKQRGDA